MSYATSNAFTRLAATACTFCAIGFLNAADAPAQTRNASDVINQMRVKRMSQELNLTTEQQGRVKELLDDERKQIAEVQQNAALSYDKRFEKQVTIQGEIRKKLTNDILTAEQRVKYAETMAKATRRKAPAKPAANTAPSKEAVEKPK